MAKFVCSICGFTHEGFSAPEKCPICMAPSSKFSEIQESRTAEDEMEEKGDNSIGESVTKSKDADNGLGNTKDENFSDKNELIHEENLLDSVRENSLVNNEQQDQEFQLDSDEEEIIKQFNKTESPLQVVKWYKETYNVGLKEAKDRVDSVLIKHNLWKGGGSGCVVTIMVAITSTLSLTWLLLY